MADETKPAGPVRGMISDIAGRSTKMGWLIGVLDGAAMNIESVLDDAKEALRQAPNHKIAGEAVERLTEALKHTRGVSNRLREDATMGASNG